MTAVDQAYAEVQRVTRERAKNFAYGIMILPREKRRAIAAVYALRNAQVKARIDNALWKLPAIGERLKLYQLARFYRTIGMLLRGGTPLPAALQMGAELLHPLLRARLAAGHFVPRTVHRS